jgi:hypothetical protein
MNALNFGRRQLRRTALAAALGMSLASGVVLAQSNASGSIFGQTGSAGATVVVESKDTGFTREVPVDRDGRYRLSSLPVGNYTVTLKRDGQVVSTQENVAVAIGGGREVSFGGAGGSVNAQNLEGVSVIASALPSIDVSSVDTRTVLTSDQLAKLPVARNIAAAALLAPGVVAGDSRYGSQALSFGGSAASENATYINGYAVTNPLTNIGFSELPFNSIDQEQVLTGGYGAEFGRATGGVMNIITKRGTNEWKAGVAVYWEPEALEASPRNIYYPENGSSKGGQLFQYRNNNTRWKQSETAYVSGPLVKDKLFFYLTGEFTKQEGDVVGNELVAQSTRRQAQDIKTPRWLAKVDWNISDNHIVEFTGISDKQTQDLYNSNFDYANLQGGGPAASGTRIKTGGETYIGKYTGYITDDFTVTALYGKQDSKVYQVPVPGLGYDPSQPFVTDGRNGAPRNADDVPVPYNMICPAGVPAPCRVSNPLNLVSSIQDPEGYNKSDGWRLDFEYVLGSHSLRAGYDVQNLESRSGAGFSGIGYRWSYLQTADPASRPGNNAAFLPIGKQEYVQQGYQQVGGTFRVEQEAQYIEDRWQVSDRWLATIGLRNEQFKNFNADGQVYVKQRNQLAPRLGVSWDVFGDSTMKIYANAGRYHLALPNNVALRGAAGSSIYSTYYTYTGIDANGIPTGLTSLADPDNPQVCKGVNRYPYFSANCEFGDAPDPKTVAAHDIKAHFQDEYVLGMDKQIWHNMQFGARLTYRNLRNAIDDTCAAVLEGSCFLYNPGRENTFLTANGDGTYSSKTISNDDLTFYKLKRKYYALDTYLEWPFDGKYFGRIDYTYSRNYGNTEGQLLSDLGQQDVSQSQAWDDRALMEGANGLLPNDRKHVIKAFGFMQLTPEWLVSANMVIRSGRPEQCLSYIGPQQDDPIGYLDSYFHCTDSDQVRPRGSFGRLPWEYKLDLGVGYSPTWAQGLQLKMDILNVLNKQVIQNKGVQYHGGNTAEQTTPGVSPAYGRTISFSDPRIVRISATYDFTL